MDIVQEREEETGGSTNEISQVINGISKNGPY
jgi:hypothetical protein